jgi:hypothetical protein
MNRSMRPRLHLSNLLFALVVVALGALLAVGPAAAAKPKLVHELAAASHAGAPALGPEGVIWFAGHNASSFVGREGSFVGRLGPEGALTEYPLPEGHEARAPVAVTGGEVWFTVHSFDRQTMQEVVEVDGFSASGPTQTYLLDGVTGISSMTALGGDLWFSGTSGGGSTTTWLRGSIAVSTGAVQLYPLEPECRSGAIVASAGDLFLARAAGSRPRVGPPSPGPRRSIGSKPTGR